MARDGSGNYSAPTNSWNPPVDGVNATGTDFSAILADLSSAISQSVSKDGQTTITGNIPMGGYKLTGLAAGSAAGNSLRYEQVFTASAVTLLGPLAWVDGTKTAPGLRTAASSTTGLFSDTGNTFAVSCNDTEIMRWTANSTELTCGQLKFPATQNASSDANTLDDYEEGTWTPAVTFETAGDVAVTYSTRLGYYTKIGRFVHMTFDIVTSGFTHTTASGNLQVTGVPFTSANNSGQTHSGSGAFQGVTKSGYTDFSPRMAHNSQTIVIGAIGSGQLLSNVTASDTPTGGSLILRGSITFMV